MNTPDPVNTAPQRSFTPSGSTIGSSIGGALAVVIISTVHQVLHWDIDPSTASAITVLCCAGAGYFPASGRR